MGPFSYLTAERLERITGRTGAELEDLALCAEGEFRPGQIVDRRGKTRNVDVPSERLKAVHRSLLRGFFDDLRHHPCTACVKGRGGRWAADKHAGAPFLLHLDVADHFPSISQDRVFSRFVEAGATRPVAWLLSRLVCLPDRLPQGAATSNAVADVLFFPMDNRIAGICRMETLTYTRYVDDIAVSGGSSLIETEPDLRRIISAEGWDIHKEKGGLVGPGELHRLLGLTVNERPSVGRQYARFLRDDLRKAAKGLVPVSPAVIRSLDGRIAWVASTNPDREHVLRSLLEQARKHVA